MAGFADGIKSGFGLVNDVYDRRSKDNYREESLRLEGEALADKRSDTEFTQGLATAKNNRDKLDAEQDILDRQQANKNFENTNANDETRRQGVDQALTKAQTQADNAATDRQTALDLKARQQKDIDAGNIATKIVNFNPETDADYEQLAGWYEKLTKHPTIGAWTEDAFSPLEKRTEGELIEALKKMEAGQEINDEVWINGVQKLVGQSSGLMEGTTITEDTHPNAPERFRNMKIVKTEVHALSMGDLNGADKDAKVKADVAVTVVDGRGEQYTYITDMTQGRSGQGKPVDLSAKGLMQAFAMKTQFTSWIGSKRPDLLEAMKRGRFGDGNGNINNDSFLAAKREHSTAIIQDIKDKDMMNDPISAGSSLTWGQYIKTNDFTNYVESSLLMPSTKVKSSRNETRYTLNIMRDTNEIKKIDRLRKEQGNPKLTDREVLTAATYFDSTQDGEVKVDGSKEWKAFNEKMGYGARFKGGIGQNTGRSFREIAQAVQDSRD
jgi:hypothetical protein